MRLLRQSSQDSGNSDENDHRTDWRSIYVANIVAALTALQMGSIAPTVWPYMQIINPSLTVAMFGLFRGASSLANVISSGIAGALANRFKDTKILIIIGKVLNIIAATVYLFIELKESVATWLFLAYDILAGFSGGFASTYRTYVAMESKEEERSKAFGMAMFAHSIGFMLGPLIQLLFTLIKYPGVSLFLGFHLNLYTAPVYLAMITTAIGLALLVCCFNGKLRTRKKTPQISENAPEKISIQYIGLDGYVTTRFGVNVAEEEPLHATHNIKIDKFAVFVLLVVKVTFDLNMLAVTSLMTPYAMTAFEWTSANSVTNMSALMLANGCASMFFSVGYMFFKFGQRIPERIALVTALSIFLLFFVITYPWAFYKTTIPYQHVVGEQGYYSQFTAKEILNSQNTTNEQLVGCNINYAWCETTPQINKYLFLVCLVFAMGISLPMSQVNLDILYSKMLGPIKQGVLQALFFGLGQLLNVFGPYAMTEIYTISGPTYIWIFEMSFSLLSLMLLVFNYGRMISFTDRVDYKVRKHQLVNSNDH